MNIFKQRKYKKAFELLVSIVVVVNLIGGTVVPKVVQAEETTDTKEAVLPMLENMEGMLENMLNASVLDAGSVEYNVLPIVDGMEDLMEDYIEKSNIAANTKENSTFPLAGERSPRRTVWVLATAYSSDVAQTDSTPCIPANGYNLCEHYNTYGSGNTIAANFLRFDTQVKFPGVFEDKVFISRDRMNRKYNGQMRIDIWMPSRAEAIQFGARWIEMEIY